MTNKGPTINILVMVKTNNKALATKGDILNIKTGILKTINEAVDAILKGMNRMFKEERKFNTETFATKEDLKREAGWLKDDIKGLKADLSDTVSRKEFNQFTAS